MATRSRSQVAALVWNYHDDDLDAPASMIELEITGLPTTATRILVEHFRVDGEHSNAFTVWKSFGSPQNPTVGQFAALEAAGQLQLLESPRWVKPGNRYQLWSFTAASVAR